MLYILTITLDDLRGLRSTIESLDQFYCDQAVVHIIKNGRFGDRSSELARTYNAFNQNRQTILIEQDDISIYDAMNQALAYVPENSWFVFLNSGDLLSGTLSLDHLSSCFLVSAFFPMGENSSKYVPIRVKQGYFNGMPFCHQSLFMKRNNRMSFSLRYPISADYMFVLQYVRPLYPESPQNIPVHPNARVIYDATGISSTKKIARDYQALQIIWRTSKLTSLFNFIFSRLLALPKYLTYLFRASV